MQPKDRFPPPLAFLSHQPLPRLFWGHVFLISSPPPSTRASQSWDHFHSGTHRTLQTNQPWIQPQEVRLPNLLPPTVPLRSAQPASGLGLAPGLSEPVACSNFAVSLHLIKCTRSLPTCGAGSFGWASGLFPSGPFSAFSHCQGDLFGYGFSVDLLI